MVPATRPVRTRLPGVVVDRLRALGAEDVHPLRLPPRTRIARSLLDAAAWARSDDAARSIVAAGVQQRLTRAGHLAMVLARFSTIRLDVLLASTLADIAGGAEALSELDFARLARRYRLPEPDRQAMRVDGQGRRRPDAFWDGARLVVEVDGLWHMEAAAWWADMRRENDLTLSGAPGAAVPGVRAPGQPRGRGLRDPGCARPDGQVKSPPGPVWPRARLGPGSARGAPVAPSIVV